MSPTKLVIIVLKAYNLRRYNLVYKGDDTGLHIINTVTRSHAGVRLPERGAKIEKVLISKLIPVSIYYGIHKIDGKLIKRGKKMLNGKERDLIVIDYISKGGTKIQCVIEERTLSDPHIKVYYYLYFGGEKEIKWTHELQNIFHAIFDVELPLNLK